MRTLSPLGSPLLLGACVVALGCGAESWAPPAPAGVTYQYDHQGFRERKTNVVAGTFSPAPGLGMAYGGAFSFRNESELHGKAEADPFAESTPIDGLRFNEHLAGQGRRLPPSVAVTKGSSAAPPKSSASAPASSVASPLPPPSSSAAPSSSSGGRTW